MEFRFVAEHLSPGERLGEILFGLIMTLTFTIGAGFWIGTEEGASAELLLATIGCNVAWGVVDGALLVLGRVFDRSRLARLGRAIAARPREDEARATRRRRARRDPCRNHVGGAAIRAVP
jgi:hypothetical protein